jgi:hypothetical protein
MNKNLKDSALFIGKLVVKSLSCAGLALLGLIWTFIIVLLYRELTVDLLGISETHALYAAIVIVVTIFLMYVAHKLNLFGEQNLMTFFVRKVDNFFERAK